MTKAIFAGGMLIPVFDPPQTPEERDRVEKEREQRVDRLIDRICKSSPTGKKSLNRLLPAAFQSGLTGIRETVWDHIFLP